MLDREKSRQGALRQNASYTEEEKLARRIKNSCTQRGISIEDFDGFSAPEGVRLRQSPEGKAWKLDILQKCNFTCDKCSQVGGKLVAHHLNGFNSHPEQRIDINNGICLCESCHKDFHSEFGKGSNTDIQYNKFKQLK